MARNRDWKEKRAREDEKEEEFRRSKVGQAEVSAGPTTNIDTRTLLDQVHPLIEQCNTLYNQYFAGAEKRPPIEQRARLDALIERLGKIQKPTPALQFRYQAVMAQYQTYRDRWEKLLQTR